MTAPREPRTRKPAARPRGAKRDRILDVATEHFGRDGFEDTKWADVAAAVGIGSTALYHYFESKQHCLYVIMDCAIAGFQARFDKITSGNPDHAAALVDVMYDAFDLSELEILRNRVLVAEQGLLAVRASSPREEAARVAARSRARDLEFAYGTFLARAMEQGAFPERDPKLLTHALLGLLNSVWHWYRPGRSFPLDEVADFYVELARTMIGLPPGVGLRKAA
jgi:TetR/AcrR family transcriptional regulator, cholesterol catabolism regulator